jgi:hypothetical protein
VLLSFVTQNVPGTAPGSQGVFGAKGVGSEWAPGNFLELVLSCPVAGTSAQFLISSEIQIHEFEIKKDLIILVSTVDNSHWFQ